jgi:hypothetical protein
VHTQEVARAPGSKVLDDDDEQQRRRGPQEANNVRQFVVPPPEPHHAAQHIGRGGGDADELRCPGHRRQVGVHVEEGTGDQKQRDHLAQARPQAL